MHGAIWRDIRHAIRAPRRTPAFTVTAAITLALAMGANASVFSLLNALTLRPLAIRNPEQLVENRGGITRRDDHATGGNVLWIRTAARLRRGLAVAIVSTGPLRALRFGVSPYDPVMLFGVAAVLLMVTMSACIVPAFRASGIDPSIGLRTE